jgi:hypothetical protein
LDSDCACQYAMSRSAHWWPHPYLVFLNSDEIVERLHLDQDTKKVGAQSLEQMLLEHFGGIAKSTSSLVEELNVEVKIRNLGLPIDALACSGIGSLQEYSSCGYTSECTHTCCYRMYVPSKTNTNKPLSRKSRSFERIKATISTITSDGKSGYHSEMRFWLSSSY